MAAAVFTKVETARFLFLPDTHFEDIVTIDQLLNADKPAPRKKQWTVLPKFFYGLKDWPKQCNLKCCSCGDNYNTIPFRMPVRMVNDNDRIGFEGEYNYCSVLCTAKAIGKIADISTREQRLSMLRLECKYYYGFTPKSFPSIPDASDRDEYGGSMSTREIRRTINNKIREILDGVDHGLDDSSVYLDTK